MLISHTLVIGAGGTGGILIPALARLLAYHPNANSSLLIADGDSFEAHNSTRQIAGPSQLDRNKAAVLAQLCHDQGLINVDAHEDYVDAKGIRRWLDSIVDDDNPVERPLIVAAVDNHATRRATLEVLERYPGDFFWVSPGNTDGTDEIRANVFWWGRLSDSDQRLTFGMDPRLGYPEIASNASDIPRRGSCALLAPSKPQLLAANMAAASFTLAVIQNLLDGQLDPSHSGVVYNGRTLKSSCN